MGKIRIEECCEILDSQRIPITASDRKKGFYPYYGANGIQDYVDDYIFDDELVLLAEDGGNFGSKERPIAYRVSGKCWVNNHAHVLKPKTGFDVDYLCYALMFYDVGSLVNGATRMKLTQAAMRQMTIPLKDLGEQKRIVHLISLAQTIIQKRRQQLAALDELVKARFVEMFGEVENNKYPVVRLGDYAKLQGGYAFKSKDFVDNGVPIVQIGNVNQDYLDWDVINAVPEEYLEKYREFALNEGDLVMAMTRPIIKSLDSIKIAKVSALDLPCLLNQRVGRFKVKDKLHPLFLEVLCKMEDFKDYVEKMSGNSLQPNISSKQVEDYMIVLPPLSLQESFSYFVKKIDKTKSAIQKSLEKTQLLFDSLMQEYFG